VDDTFVIREMSKIGRLMTNFMFTINITDVTDRRLNGLKNMTFLVISSSVPKSSREFSKIRIGRVDRTNNRQYEYTLPLPSVIEHSWNVKILLPEISNIYQLLTTWYYLLDEQDASLDNLKTNAQIVLYGISKNPIVQFELIGLYPTSIPGIDDLNNDSNDSNIELDCSFAYDHINYLTPPTNAIG
jgi:hypothetical protein